jgi:hypothetical protein
LEITRNDGCLNHRGSSEKQIPEHIWKVGLGGFADGLVVTSKKISKLKTKAIERKK